MSVEQIITAIGLVGLGGLLKSSLDYIIGLKKNKIESKQVFKEVRYKAIILLSHAYLRFEEEKSTLAINRPDIESRDQLYNELNAEWINMSLYASDDVIDHMKRFLEKQSTDSFNELILSMRKDLFGMRTKLKPRSFKIKKEEK